jgi:hypothetical protein
VKDPIEPYRGKCQGCGLTDWLDVAHQCSFCFAHMSPAERSIHMQHIRWVNAGRPADTDNPWE